MNTTKSAKARPATSAETSTNAPEISVSDLASALKRTLEDTFGFVRVRGEISGYRGPHSSGHAYFALKDANARIDAVVWRTTFSRMRVKPEEGLEVVATGKITSFPAKSTYQIVVESLEPAGAGALMALLEMRRKKFADAGLFDASRKQPLPFLPRVIGVVTSPTGAVIRDILHRLADRLPCHVVIWPVRVQGEGSAQEIAAAIRGMDALTGDARPDVLIVARGGGSLEDLWSFNEEEVVMAAAQARLPIVSAVGHETDWTLLDHVADVRAPTPTAAAELCTPVRAALEARVAEARGRLREALRGATQRKQSELRAAARTFATLRSAPLYSRQRLDAVADGLEKGLRHFLMTRALTLASRARRFSAQVSVSGVAGRREPLRRLELRLGLAANKRIGGARELARDARHALERLARRRLDGAGQRFANLATSWDFRRKEIAARPAALHPTLARASQALARLLRDRAQERRARLAGLGGLLDAYGYRSVLARGFALVTDRSGAPVTGVEEARAAGALVVEFADGQAPVTVDGRPARRSARKPAQAREQGSLF